MFKSGNAFGRTAAKAETRQDPKETTAEAQREVLERATIAFEAKSEELTGARSRLESLERQAGVLDADNEDSTAATDAVQAATIIVRRLENSLSVLLQRKAEAEGALTNAQLLATEEAKIDAWARVLALAPRGESLLIEVEQFMSDLSSAVEELPVACGNTYAWAVVEIMAQFNLFLSISKRHPSSKGFDSGAFRKYKSFSECLEKICGNGARR